MSWVSCGLVPAPQPREAVASRQQSLGGIPVDPTLVFGRTGAYVSAITTDAGDFGMVADDPTSTVYSWWGRFDSSGRFQPIRRIRSMYLSPGPNDILAVDQGALYRMTYDGDVSGPFYVPQSGLTPSVNGFMCRFADGWLVLSNFFPNPWDISTAFFFDDGGMTPFTFKVNSFVGSYTCDDARAIIMSSGYLAGQQQQVRVEFFDPHDAGTVAVHQFTRTSTTANINTIVSSSFGTLVIPEDTPRVAYLVTDGGLAVNPVPASTLLNATEKRAGDSILAIQQGGRVSRYQTSTDSFDAVSVGFSATDAGQMYSNIFSFGMNGRFAVVNGWSIPFDSQFNASGPMVPSFARYNDQTLNGVVQTSRYVVVRWKDWNAEDPAPNKLRVFDSAGTALTPVQTDTSTTMGVVFDRPFRTAADGGYEMGDVVDGGFVLAAAPALLSFTKLANHQYQYVSSPNVAWRIDVNNAQSGSQGVTSVALDGGTATWTPPTYTLLSLFFGPGDVVAFKYLQLTDPYVGSTVEDSVYVSFGGEMPSRVPGAIGSQLAGVVSTGLVIKPADGGLNLVPFDGGAPLAFNLTRPVTQAVRQSGDIVFTDTNRLADGGYEWRWFDLDGGEHLAPLPELSAPAVSGNAVALWGDFSTLAITAEWELIAGQWGSYRAYVYPFSLAARSSAAVDAGWPDAGESDAGAVDAGDLDAGDIDAGVADSGVVDAGSVDAGSVDAGDVDAGSVDSGIMDAGDVDAGSLDAGSLDAGSLDAGATVGAGDGGAQQPVSLVVGCGCTSAPLNVFLFGAMALLSAARKRARTRSNENRG